MNKVLVCITPQSNSHRLIDRGHEAAQKTNGALHILHVEKGNDIFISNDTSKLLQELFNYGSGLGGIVHGLCGENIVNTIMQFIKDEKITHIVLGESPENVKPLDIDAILRTEIPHLEIIILRRS